MIRFGLRLTLNGGKDAAIRLALTTVAVALGVGMLLAILSTTNAVQSQNSRYAWLTSGFTAEQSAPEGPMPRAAGSDTTAGDVDGDPVWWLARVDYFDGDQIIRVDVAATGQASPVPPGIPDLPAPGEHYASPAMSEALASAPSAVLDDRFGSTEVGTIGSDALPAPDSMVIVVGRAVDELARSPHAVEATSIATDVPDDCPRCYAVGVIRNEGITIILAVAAVALLFPVLVFIGSATRLSAARREQRFAAMRLVGATPRQISTIATVESTAAAAIGVIAGFGAFAAVRPLLGRISFTGYRFFVSDLSLTPRDIVLTAVGVPVAAAIAARLALRRVQVSPLGVSRRTTPAAPRAWRLIPLLAGIAELTYWYVAGRPETTNAQILSYMSGILLTMIGLLVAGPWLTMVGSRLMTRRARRPATLIAARRLTDDPKAGFRSISGLVLALFVTSLTTGIIATLTANRGAEGSATAEETLVQRFMAADEENRPVAPTDLIDELQDIPGVTGAAIIHIDFSAGPDPWRDGMLVSCGELADVPTLGRCDDGAETASIRPFFGSEASDLREQARTTWPAATHSDADLEGLPVEGIYVATDGSTQAIELARTTLFLSLADQDVLPATLAEHTAMDDRQLAQWQQGANMLVLMTLPIAGCSLAVSVVAGLNVRRRPFSLLRLSGTPLRSLQRVVALESVVPLVLGAATSIGTGLLTAHLFLRTQVDYSLQPPGTEYIAFTLAGLAASVAVIASTLPLLRRVTGPETARSE